MKNYNIVFVLFLISLCVGCMHPYDIPIIGWRMEVAAQREAYEDAIKRIEKRDKNQDS